MIQQPGGRFRSYPAIFFFDACFRYVKLLNPWRHTTNEDNRATYVNQADFDKWM